MTTPTARIGPSTRRRGIAAVATAAVGLAVGVAAGAPAVTGLLQLWREAVTPAFLELYLAGFPFCS